MIKKLSICSVTFRLIQLQLWNGIKAIPPWKAKLKSWINGCLVTVWCALSIVFKVTLVDCGFVILRILSIPGITHALLSIREERVMPPPFWMFWVRLLLNYFSTLSIHKFWPSVFPFVRRYMYVDWPSVCLVAIMSLSFFLSVCLSRWLTDCLSVTAFLSVCLFLSLSGEVSLSICLSNSLWFSLLLLVGHHLVVYKFWTNCTSSPSFTVRWTWPWNLIINCKEKRDVWKLGDEKRFLPRGFRMAICVTQVITTSLTED